MTGILLSPFTLKNLPNPVWKSRFVRAFIWVMPEMAQEIGAIIYRGCDSVLYASLVFVIYSSYRIAVVLLLNYMMMMMMMMIVVRRQ